MRFSQGTVVKGMLKGFTEGKLKAANQCLQPRVCPKKKNLMEHSHCPHISVCLSWCPIWPQPGCCCHLKLSSAGPGAPSGHSQAAAVIWSCLVDTGTGLAQGYRLQGTMILTLSHCIVTLPSWLITPDTQTHCTDTDTDTHQYYDFALT